MILLSQICPTVKIRKVRIIRNYLILMVPIIGVEPTTFALRIIRTTF
ncbi:hypothetical protein G3F71_004381 [Salmonella enterica]|nr:hypothetical protein [Salmonella enterica]HAE1781665.1 hypothetical protein [Salmonella enterica subsp. enterica serovar Typhisuis]